MIGITGGIGSGKSTLTHELVSRGFCVYDCDREAKRIVAQDKQVQQAIIDLLGEDSFVENNYNTAYVAKRVFEDSRLLDSLQAIIHPAVKADILLKKPDFIESAILYESGLDSLCDGVVIVDAPQEIRVARTINRDFGGHATQDNINKVQARIRAQRELTPQLFPQKKVLTIINDGRTSIEELAQDIINTFCAE